jgi:hypothetical protein
MIDDPNDAGPPIDSRPQDATDVPQSTPYRPPGKRASSHPVVIGCLGIFSCLSGLFVFGMMTGLAMSPWPIYGLCVAVVVGLFLLRLRSGASPELSAVAAGAAVALVIVGLCVAAFAPPTVR